MEILEKAKKMDSNYVDTHHNLALAYLKNGEGWKVNHLYWEAIEQDPENIDFNLIVFTRPLDPKFHGVFLQ